MCYIVHHPKSVMEIIVVELAIWKPVIDAHVYKAEKHSDMPMSYRRSDSKPGSSQLEPEVVWYSTYSLLQKLSTSSKSKTTTLKAMG